MNKKKLKRLQAMAAKALELANGFEKTPEGQRLVKQLDRQAERLRAKKGKERA